MPDSVPADSVPAPGDEAKKEVAELSAQLAQQRAELAGLREEMQRKLADEKAAREAAEAKAETNA
ncbi:MAG: hypothetical protein WCG85_15125, partial [Polyangia bacterium]